MVQVIQKAPGFAERLGSAIGGGLGQGFQQGMSRSQEFANQMKLQEAKQKKDTAIQKFQTLQSLNDTVGELKRMAEEDVEGIGRFGSWSQSEKALQNRGLFNTLSSELFSYYKTLFPRGITQEEFKRIQKDYIPKDNDSTNAMIGKLEGFQKLIEKKLQEQNFQGEEESESLGRKQKKQVFDSSNPEHKKKAEQLFKTFGDKEKVREKLRKEFEGI